ncbi:guanine deaminase [Aerococcus kribbianus]|uniref:Guanine deaminase n=1 Tax=Aerococcus kribbianus TaxID=2999064 RepID=A0A9X3FN66_9LACT|nr:MULTISPECIES: guanine deaminase [unclassified Aerococcus]MCZ0717369.1 guanine deaminase [Aerococcus sp. YH-aer221]MCZ0725657.1 guanine deaminase [Aerococcus sp. YH-aer222]
MQIQAIKGSFFTSPVYGEVNFHDNALIEVDRHGVISDILFKDQSGYQEALAHYRHQEQLVELSPDQYLLPGFIDTHIHAPQWPQLGVALDRPLNEWLEQHTFPLEAKYANLEFAHTVYTDLVEQLLAHGTTTALYFATIHMEASLELAKICAEKGQRGLVGKVVMDHPTGNPDYYRDESTEKAIADTEDFIKKVRQMAETVPQGLYPVITPRFAPSCTDQALAALGQLATKYQCHVQSHCSEGQWEHDVTAERFGKTDTQALADFGLFGPKSVMAHCNFISDEDAKIFRKHQTAVAHCPISNVYFANSVLPVRHLKDLGVEIALGTDISAGYTPSLYENMRQAVMSSRQLEEGVDTSLPASKRGVVHSRIGMNEAFYLATTGGGEALDLAIGQIAPGYACDLQVVSTSHNKDFAVFSDEEHILHRLLYSTNSDNIEAVYCQGRLVHTKNN